MRRVASAAALLIGGLAGLAGLAATAVLAATVVPAVLAATAAPAGLTATSPRLTGDLGFCSTLTVRSVPEPVMGVKKRLISSGPGPRAGAPAAAAGTGGVRAGPRPSALAGGGAGGGAAGGRKSAGVLVSLFFSSEPLSLLGRATDGRGVSGGVSLSSSITTSIAKSASKASTVRGMSRQVRDETGKKPSKP